MISNLLFHLLTALTFPLTDELRCKAHCPDILNQTTRCNRMSIGIHTSVHSLINSLISQIANTYALHSEEYNSKQNSLRKLIFFPPWDFMGLWYPVLRDSAQD